MKVLHKLPRSALYLLLGISFSPVLMAADCSINYDQDTTISADCDGFSLDRNQDFDISIITGVSVRSPGGGDDNVIKLYFDMGGVLTNNGTIETTYGNTEYCSSIQQNNIFACQFHPEKSGEIGINIYKNIKEEYCS